MKITLLTLVLFIVNFNFSYSQVAPLLTTTWNQGCYYNDSVPAIGSGPCGKAYTGCVPTAIAQLLKYHNYPTSGWGTNTYSPACCGSLSLDFSTQTYNYAAMPNSISSSNPQIAQLMYHCGIAAEAFYSGSNTISGGSISDMKRYFKYSLLMDGTYKSSLTNTEFENLLISELDAGRPVTAVGGSHQYIIDGYQTSPSLKFHINFGWGGSYNGYYNIHNVVVSSTNYTPVLITHHIMPLVGGFEVTDTVNGLAQASNVSIQLSSLNNWTMTGSSPWITPALNSGVSGYYQTNLSLAANPNYTTRYGTVQYSNGTITKTVVIVQHGIQPVLSVSPLSSSISSAGGMVSATITTDSTWTATTSYTWLSLSASTGTGNGMLDITAAPNGPTSRTGYVTIQRGGLSEVIEIIQGSNASFWCIPAMTTGGSDGITNVTFNSINRTSAINEGYLLTTDTTSIYWDSTYTISVTFQGGVAPGVWIDWNLDGDFSDPSEAVASPSGSWYPSFNSIKTMNITVPSNATLGLTRMRVYGKDFGTGPVSNPCGTTDAGGDIEDYHIIVKDKRFIETDVISMSFTSASSSQSLVVSTDSLWVLSGYPSWITPSMTNGMDNANVNITVSNNPSFVPRNGLLTFTRGSKYTNINVYQAALDSMIQFTVDTVFVNSTGTTSLPLSVMSNFDYDIQSLDTWITNATTTGSGNSTFFVDVTSNLSGVRTGSVVIGKGSFHDTLVVLQDSVSVTLNVSPDTLFFTSNGGSQIVTITTPSIWYGNVADSWISLSQITGTGTQPISVQCDTNYSVSRQTLLEITISGNSKQVVIMQEDGATTGIVDVGKKTRLIYPNPTTGILTIDYDFNNLTNTEIIILDITGQVIENYINVNKLNIQSLPNGIYLLMIKQNGVLIDVRKIIKE